MARHYNPNDRGFLRFTGHELITTAAQLLGGQINDGIQDGGVDLYVKGIGGVQVKCSPCALMDFFGEALRRGKFIAVIVGEHGTEAEMIASLRQFGAWFGKDIPDRQVWLTCIAKVRETISQANKKRIEVK